MIRNNAILPEFNSDLNRSRQGLNLGNKKTYNHTSISRRVYATHDNFPNKKEQHVIVHTTPHKTYMPLNVL